MERRRRRRSTQLRDDVQETRGCWKLKDEALACTLWRTRFGKGFGPAVRQTTELNISSNANVSLCWAWTGDEHSI